MRIFIIEERHIYTNSENKSLRIFEDFLIRKSANTEYAIQFAAKCGIIYNSVFYEVCFIPMSLVKLQRRIDGYEWRCTSFCKRSQCMRKNSYFYKNKLEIGKVFRILYKIINRTK
ncbi:hypothetical protein TCON_0630 [Astathelohania contejeani]|uniref:Uncharacterized protein n=1 Tax=Astathelohania contejeani TaxID=164912 RepID=A0ABQ7I1B0_9MICR|nr:hypothetical protein TCON_0630 [Thelohania contejeani]